MLESTSRSSHAYSRSSERSYNECVWSWVPSSSVKVTWLFLTLLIFPTLHMLESTPRSTLYHVCNRRYERSCKKVFDLDFQGHALKLEFFHSYGWIPWPWEHTHEKYVDKIRTESSLGATSSISLENCTLWGFHETWGYQSTHKHIWFSQGVHVVPLPVWQKSKMAANV